MFADNTLTPRESLRLCALGTIAEGPMRYADLAGSVRHFVSRIMGPSPELMHTNIELLRHEGLVRAAEGDDAEHDDDAVLAITEAGRRELRALLTARLRPGSDLSKLVIALKMRFLHLLEPREQRSQADLLIETVEQELARLIDLRQHHAPEAARGSLLVEWLDHDIDLLETRLRWLEAFHRRL